MISHFFKQYLFLLLLRLVFSNDAVNEGIHNEMLENSSYINITSDIDLENLNRTQNLTHETYDLRNLTNLLQIEENNSELNNLVTLPPEESGDDEEEEEEDSEESDEEYKES
uniref:Uncharacterized protein n=1 Tax=Parastrongyloides trichosuri TaxID=131310 RepID=A0A0N4Z683_PARTI